LVPGLTVGDGRQSVPNSRLLVGIAVFTAPGLLVLDNTSRWCWRYRRVFL